MRDLTSRNKIVDAKKKMLAKQKGYMRTTKDILHNALLTLNFLNVSKTGTARADRLWIIKRRKKPVDLYQPVYYKDAMTSAWRIGEVL